MFQAKMLKGNEDLKSFDIRHRDTELGVCPGGFWSCISVKYFLTVLPSLFWNGHVYSVLVGFDFLGD